MINKYCQTNNCPFRKSCLRWVNVGDYSLKFFDVAPVVFDNGKPECDYYIGDKAEYLLEVLKSTMKKKPIGRKLSSKLLKKLK